MSCARMTANKIHFVLYGKLLLHYYLSFSIHNNYIFEKISKNLGCRKIILKMHQIYWFDEKISFLYFFFVWNFQARFCCVWRLASATLSPPFLPSPAFSPISSFCHIHNLTLLGCPASLSSSRFMYTVHLLISPHQQLRCYG